MELIVEICMMVYTAYTKELPAVLAGFGVFFAVTVTMSAVVASIHYLHRVKTKAMRYKAKRTQLFHLSLFFPLLLLPFRTHFLGATTRLLQLRNLAHPEWFERRSCSFFPLLDFMWLSMCTLLLINSSPAPI